MDYASEVVEAAAKALHRAFHGAGMVAPLLPEQINEARHALDNGYCPPGWRFAEIGGMRHYIPPQPVAPPDPIAEARTKCERAIESAAAMKREDYRNALVPVAALLDYVNLLAAATSPGAGSRS